MAKQDKSKYAPDLIPASAEVEVVKINILNMEFVGMKIMEYSEYKNMNKQKGFIYRCFQKGYSQFHLKDKK